MKASASHNPATSLQLPCKDRNIGAKLKVVRDEQGSKNIWSFQHLTQSNFWCAVTAECKPVYTAGTGQFCILKLLAGK